MKNLKKSYEEVVEMYFGGENAMGYSSFIERQSANNSAQSKRSNYESLFPEDRSPQSSFK
jgi:hypothetical protein